MEENRSEWAINSWRKFKISQQPEYEDPEQLEEVLDKVIFYFLK
jgi:3-deoxy-D-arabino-heptulosonate 7-phosphate (DAHP) synthase class II